MIGMIVTGASAYANGLPGWLALVVVLLPFPFNIALCVFVWRSVSHNPSGWNDLAVLIT